MAKNILHKKYFCCDFCLPGFFFFLVAELCSTNEHITVSVLLKYLRLAQDFAVLSLLFCFWFVAVSLSLHLFFLSFFYSLGFHVVRETFTSLWFALARKQRCLCFFPPNHLLISLYYFVILYCICHTVYIWVLWFDLIAVFLFLCLTGRLQG